VQCGETLRVQAYFDGEVDAPAAADIERHAEHCPECRALLAELGEMRARLRRELPWHSAPAQLRAEIGRMLDRETASGAAAAPAPAKAVPRPGRTRPWRARPFWLGALGGVGAALAASVAFFVLAPLPAQPLLDELASAHVRSLMPGHLTDVISTDRHTVKPWFAGHADVSPVVADFAAQGYRLVGGRAEYFDHQRAAVVVYEHGAHVINVFSWVAGVRTFPDTTTRSGYHFVFWQAGNLQYCAVSDAGWDELQGLVRLLRDLASRDAPQ
jgi:anti-sigma factor RsiW